MPIDRIDNALLTAMEKNSRISLKNLAEELNVKTSTIYHRLHKLKESNILESFTIVINPEEIGLKINCMLKIKIKKMVVGPLDNMFLESFAKYLSETFEEIIFSSVGDDGYVHSIATFRSQKHFESVLEQIKQNPYIDTIDTINFTKIMKGKKLFSYVSSKYEDEGEEEHFDDDLDEESDDESTFEIEL